MKPTRNMTDAEYDNILETTKAIKSAERKKNKTTFAEVCQEIVDSQSCKRWRGRLIDHFSASAFNVVYKALKPDAQAKLAEIAERNPMAALSICFKLCK